MFGKKRHCLRDLLSDWWAKRIWPERSCHVTGAERHLLKIPDISPQVSFSWYGSLRGSGNLESSVSRQDTSYQRKTLRSWWEPAVRILMLAGRCISLRSSDRGLSIPPTKFAALSSQGRWFKVTVPFVEKHHVVLCIDHSLVFISKFIPWIYGYMNIYHSTYEYRVYMNIPQSVSPFLCRQKLDSFQFVNITN